MKQLLPFVCFTLLLALSASCKPNSEERLKIDHLILAVNDLEWGMKQFEEKTGIKPEYGGGHPNGYTHNAIVPLIGGMYLEILAPEDNLDSIPKFFQTFENLTPIGFAISSNDLIQLEKDIKDLGYMSSGVDNSSRVTPNGVKLQWKLLMIEDEQIGMNPFFISWDAGSKHPSEMQKVQITLKKLNLSASKNGIVELVEKRGDDIVLTKFSHEQADTITLSFTLDTPKGLISFK